MRSFFPAARTIRYTPEMKTTMVLKAKDTIRRGCLEYDAGATDITQSFMAIGKNMASSGRSSTYEASHADIAWATMHALLNELLSVGSGMHSTSILDIDWHEKTSEEIRHNNCQAPQKMEASAFGVPSAALDHRDILDYVECINNGKWYEPLVNFSGLAKSLRTAVHHSSPIYVKRNILTSTYIPRPLLSRQDFSRFMPDYLVFANGYLEKRMSVTGQRLKLETSPAKYTRRGVEDGVY